MNDLEGITRLSVISDADVARLADDAALAELSAEITATPHGWSAAHGPRLAARGRTRRHWLIGAPAAIGLAVAAALVMTALDRPAIMPGIRTGPMRAEALAFIRHGHYLDVVVRNPFADPKRYRAEFRAHHLDVTLKLVPASPSIVGTVVYFGGTGTSAIKTITAQGKCFTGGGFACPVGLRIPLHFRGQADLVFGRPARPGERYESTTSATAPGEALHGLAIKGLTVAAVLKLVAERHVTVPVFHVTTAKGIGAIWPPSRVPGTWYVYDADPWAPGQVILWVGKSQQSHEAPPSPGTPVPTPTPTSSG